MSGEVIRMLVGLVQAGEPAILALSPSAGTAPIPVMWRRGRLWSWGVEGRGGRVHWGPAAEIPGLQAVADLLHCAARQAMGCHDLWAVMPEPPGRDMSVPPWHGEA